MFGLAHGWLDSAAAGMGPEPQVAKVGGGHISNPSRMVRLHAGVNQYCRSFCGPTAVTVLVSGGGCVTCKRRFACGAGRGRAAIHCIFSSIN
jgi:hypothetical protein